MRCSLPMRKVTGPNLSQTHYLVLVTTYSGTWHYQERARTGWLSITIMWMSGALWMQHDWKYIARISWTHIKGTNGGHRAMVQIEDIYKWYRSTQTVYTDRRHRPRAHTDSTNRWHISRVQIEDTYRECISRTHPEDTYRGHIPRTHIKGRLKV